MANVSKNKKTVTSSSRVRGRLQKVKASSSSKKQEEENKTPHYRTRRRTVKKYQDDMSDVEYESKIEEEGNSSDQETFQNKSEDMETNKKDNTKVDKEIEEDNESKSEKDNGGDEEVSAIKTEDKVEEGDDKVYGSPKEEEEKGNDANEEGDDDDDDDDDDDEEDEEDEEEEEEEDDDDEEFEQEEESSEDEYGLPTLNRKRKLNADKSPSPPPLPTLLSYPKSPPKKRKLRPQNNSYMPKVALNLVDEDDLDLQYNETKYTNHSHSNHSAVILGSPTKLRSIDKQQHSSVNSETTLVATTLSPSFDNSNTKDNTITKDKSSMSVDDVFESTEIKHQDEDKRQHKKRKDISTQVLDKLGKQIVNDQLDFSQHSFIPKQYNSIIMDSSITSTTNNMKENDRYDSVYDTNDDDIIMDKVDQEEEGYSVYNESINMQQNDPHSDKETNKNAGNPDLSNNIPNKSENDEDNTQSNEKPGFFKKLLRFFFN